MDDTEHRRRTQRREFIRTHHPDRGGEATEFLTGLSRFAPDPPATADTPAPRIVFVPRNPRPRRLLRALLCPLRPRQPPRVR